jgi:hypothetical protein
MESERLEHRLRDRQFPARRHQQRPVGARPIVFQHFAYRATAQPAAAEYTGASPAIDNGYVVDSTGAFDGLVVLGANGSIVQTPLPAISIDVQGLAEGGAGAHNIVFTLTQSVAVPYATSVHVDTRDETAFSGFDYLAVHQVVTFAPGATRATVSVPIYGNSSFQFARAFEVNLSNATGA